MNAAEFIVDIIDGHHDNFDGEPAGDGIEEEVESAPAASAVVLKFTDGTRLRVVVEDLPSAPAGGVPSD